MIAAARQRSPNHTRPFFIQGAQQRCPETLPGRDMQSRPRPRCRRFQPAVQARPTAVAGAVHPDPGPRLHTQRARCVSLGKPPPLFSMERSSAARQLCPETLPSRDMQSRPRLRCRRFQPAVQPRQAGVAGAKCILSRVAGPTRREPEGCPLGNLSSLLKGLGRSTSASNPARPRPRPRCRRFQPAVQPRPAAGAGAVHPDPRRRLHTQRARCVSLGKPLLFVPGAGAQQRASDAEQARRPRERPSCFEAACPSARLPGSAYASGPSTFPPSKCMCTW